MTPIENLAMHLYELDGFNFACFPTEEAWKRDREDVRQRYRDIAKKKLSNNPL